jgi:hypothetical protein
MRGVRRFTDLRAWQACDVYKKAIYKLIDSGVYGNDWKRRRFRALHGDGAFVVDGITEPAARRR